MKEKIVFDPANAADTDNVGAYVIASDGTLITHHTESGSQGLDVYLLNPSIEVTATDLDIRDLTQADEVTVYQGTDPWVVSATDFDIRNLDYSQDNVAIKGATGNQLVVESDGSINVNADISVVNGHEKAEDAAAADGDIGSYVLNVRQDTLATSTSASGDYQSFKSDSLGSLWVHVSEIPKPPADNQLANDAVIVGLTAVPMTASLVGRRRILIQNVDTSKPIFVGDAAVTIANGLRLSPGAVLEIELDDGATIYGIAGVAGVLTRVLETGYV